MDQQMTLSELFNVFDDSRNVDGFSLLRLYVCAHVSGVRLYAHAARVCARTCMQMSKCVRPWPW